MTRFLFVTDTHIGGEAGGWCQQPRRLDVFPQVLAAVERYVREHRVDFVVHGGDCTDAGTAEHIDRAAAAFKGFPCPTYLALGNHDLLASGAFEAWRKRAPQLFGATAPGDAVTPEAFGVRFADMGLFVLMNHWFAVRTPPVWMIEEDQVPLLTEAQLAKLEKFLAESKQPVAVTVHAPANSIPAAQAGTTEDIHPVHEQFLGIFRDLAQRYPALKLVLTGHNHANTLQNHGSFVSLSTCALCEPRFEARLIEIDRGRVRVQTVRFADQIGQVVETNPEKDWVTGPETARMWEG